METLETYIPEDLYSLIVMAVVAVIAIWLVMFVVRKLVGVALVAGLVIGGLTVWQNPAVLRNAQVSAVHYYDQWRYGDVDHENERRR